MSWLRRNQWAVAYVTTVTLVGTIAVWNGLSVYLAGLLAFPVGLAFPFVYLALGGMTNLVTGLAPIPFGSDWPHVEEFALCLALVATANVMLVRRLRTHLSAAA